MFSDGMSHDEIVTLAKNHFHHDAHENDSEPVFVLLVEVAVAYIKEIRKDRPAAAHHNIESLLVGLAENLELDDRVTGGIHLRE